MTPLPPSSDPIEVLKNRMQISRRISLWGISTIFVLLVTVAIAILNRGFIIVHSHLNPMRWAGVSNAIACAVFPVALGFAIRYERLRKYLIRLAPDSLPASRLRGSRLSAKLTVLFLLLSPAILVLIVLVETQLEILSYHQYGRWDESADLWISVSFVSTLFLMLWSIGRLIVMSLITKSGD